MIRVQCFLFEIIDTLIETSVANIQILNVKPIFHCNAKTSVLGTLASPYTKYSTFALPNTRNTNMLVSLALGDANFLRQPCTFNFWCVDFIRVG